MWQTYNAKYFASYIKNTGDLQNFNIFCMKIPTQTMAARSKNKEKEETKIATFFLFFTESTYFSNTNTAKSSAIVQYSFTLDILY